MTSLQAQLDRAIDDQLDGRLRAAVSDVAAWADNAGADGVPWGETIDVWDRTDATRAHPFTGPNQHNLDGDTVIRGEPFPFTVLGGPAEPGDHPGDMCEVMLDGRRVVVSGQVRRGQLDVTISSPDDVPSNSLLRTGVSFLRSRTPTTAEDDEARLTSTQRAARKALTARVRRALVRNARGRT